MLLKSSIIIKMEQDVDTGYRTVCSACLSTDRDLFDLNNSPQVYQIFRLLMCDFVGDRITTQMICWECQAMILKIKHFKARVSKAQAVLNRTVKGNSFFEGLSNLKSTGVVRVTISPQNIVPTPVAPVAPVPTQELTDPIKVDVEVEPYTTVEVKQERRERCLSGDYDELIQPMTIQQTCSDPLEKLRKFVKIELNTQEEVKHAFIAPNIKLNYRPQRVLINTPIRETTAPRGSKEMVKVTVGVPNVLKGKKCAQTVVTGKESVPTVVKVKERVPTEVKGKQIVPNEIKRAESVPTIVKYTGETQLGIYGFEEEEEEINCKMLNKTEMLKFRDDKRNNPVFGGSRYKCIKCIERFNTQEYLDNHNKKHDLEQGQSVCDICDQRFPDNSTKDLHYKAHYIVFECIKCGFKNHDRLRVTEHIRRKHDISDFQCRHCDAVFKTYREKIRHRKKVHFKRPTCEECGKSFCSVQLLRAHEAATHRGERVECTVCNKKIKSQTLKSHMKTHEDSRDDALYCVECGSTFKNKYGYEKHFKTSLKHNPIENLGFKCDHCGKYFAAKITLMDHIKVEHTSGDSCYTCSICKKEFKSKRGMIKHIKYTHEGIKRKETKIICDICGKSFKNKMSLVHHINSHLGRRPYKCQDCGHTFSYSASLYTHRRLVHKVKKKSEMNLK